MALTYGQLNAIAVNTISKVVGDNIFDSNAVLKKLSSGQYFKKLDGGIKIQEPLLYSKPTSGGWYADLDVLSTSRTENLTAAEFDWKQVHESIRISQLDLAKATGDSAKIDFMSKKIEIGSMNLRDRLGEGVFAVGTEYSGNVFNGFQGMISASSTYGGIAVADFAGWAANVRANSGTARPVTLNLINLVDIDCTEGDDSPTFLTCKKDVGAEVWNLFQPFQRLMSGDMSKLGFTNILEINGKPLIIDSHMKSGSIYFINEKYAGLKVHKDHYFRKVNHESLETSDSMLTKVFVYGNITCNNRRFQGELADIQVS
jgi:hypothetical protein